MQIHTQKHLNIFKSFLAVCFQGLFILCALYFVVKGIYNFSAGNNNDYFSFITFCIIFTILVVTVAVLLVVTIIYNLRKSVTNPSCGVDFLCELMSEKSIGANAYSYNKSLDNNLNEILSGVCYAAGLRKIPELYIINSFIPTIFAYGRNINDCKIFATSGLVKILNNEEMTAVIASEVGHIINADITFFYYLTPFVRIYMNIIRGLFRDVFVERESSDNFLADYLLAAFILRKPSVLHPVWILISVVSLIIPFIMSIFYAFLPRERIYHADMYAVKITRNKHALESALRKIYGVISLSDDSALCFYNKAFGGEAKDFPTMFLNDDVLLSKDPLLNSCFIVPVMRKFEGRGILNTHPNIKERIEILSLMTNSTFSAYNDAYAKVTGQKNRF